MWLIRLLEKHSIQVFKWAIKAVNKLIKKFFPEASTKNSSTAYPLLAVSSFRCI